MRAVAVGALRGQRCSLMGSHVVFSLSICLVDEQILQRGKREQARSLCHPKHFCIEEFFAFVVKILLECALQTEVYSVTELYFKGR